MLSNKGKLRHNADFLPFMLSDFVNTLSLYFSFLYTMDHLRWNAAAAAKSLQSSPTLCDPIDGSPSGSPVPGILKARTLEWVAISFSNAWKWKVKVKSLSCVRQSVTPWTAAHQAPPSLGFSRQEYWSGVPSPSPPNPMRLVLLLFLYGRKLLPLYLNNNLTGHNILGTPVLSKLLFHLLSGFECCWVWSLPEFLFS